MPDSSGPPPGEWRDATIAGRACRVMGNPRDVYFANLAQTAQEQRLLARVGAAVLPPDGVVLDVGANIGLAALALAPLVPRGRIHAFEPVPEPRAYLEATAAADPFGNIAVVPLAAGAAPGRVAIHQGVDFTAGSHVVDAAHAMAGHLPVLEAEVTTLDAWADAAGLARLDLIKLDVEGYEPEALEGAAGLLARFRPAVLLELNSFTLVAMRDRSPRGVIEGLLARFPHVLWFGAGGAGAPSRLAPGPALYGFIHDHLVHRRAIDDLVCCFDDGWLARLPPP